ncbi:hypothetical protein GGI15_004655 [Coemansia interrupta]|uniref:Prenylcysteine lyase domain-containing protein n=1 Tax=Coemansia interrupta TaxID=1126814 RepID=A0A9W8H9C9_9FUNG|nr:hypothetical protein GGI15_004655 [Coemansia interrupta]
MRSLRLLLTALVLSAGTLGQRARRIAIVGGGPAGAASAYFARHELQQHNTPADIHVFERLPRLGGRAHVGTVEYANRTLYFEQGASMFIGKNRHLVDLARSFNLTLCPHPCTLHPADKRPTDDDMVVDAGMLGAYGIWDPLPGPVSGPGRWVVRRHGDQWLRDMLRALWRYGGLGDLRRVRRQTREAVDQFMQSYDQFSRPHDGVYASWDAYLADRPALQQSLYYRAAELYSHGATRISQRFLREVVSLATRVNYMQDVDSISAVGAHISMAAESDEAYSVAGGNHQVFDSMLGHSAEVHLGKEVVAVERNGTGYRLVTTDGVEDGVFDTVIIAAPLPLTKIRLPEGLEDLKSAVKAEYVRMHVTFVIGTLRDDLFPSDTLRLPRLVVTPYGTTLPFNCLSILACLDGTQQCGRPGSLALFKLFSHAPIDLPQVFAHVQWHRRNTWHAYPRLEPRNGNKYGGGEGDESGAFHLPRKSLPPIVLDRMDDAGVFYVNGMETVFSTMESQTVAARHVVRLALFGENFPS